jgi:hypothetical protein
VGSSAAFTLEQAKEFLRALLPNWRDDTTLAWLYAKVLLGTLLDRMASIPTELSPPEHPASVDRAAAHVLRSVEAHQCPTWSAFSNEGTG